MMEIRLCSNNDIESKIKEYESSTGFLKEQNKYMQNSNLINFISNTNKFKFNSCFDHKGAKSFLKSKGMALKEISIDDYLIEEKEEIKYKKGEKRSHKSASSKALDKETIKQIRKGLASYKKKIRSMKNLNLFYNPHTTLELQIIGKNKPKKKQHKSNKENVYLTSIIKDEFNLDKRKIKKFYSQIEINMFNDKNLKKLKPIREKTIKSDLRSKIVYTFNAKHNYDFSFVKSDSSKVDSTLLEIVSEIDKF